MPGRSVTQNSARVTGKNAKMNSTELNSKDPLLPSRPPDRDLGAEGAEARLTQLRHHFLRDDGVALAAEVVAVQVKIGCRRKRLVGCGDVDQPVLRAVGENVLEAGEQVDRDHVRACCGDAGEMIVPPAYPRAEARGRAGVAAPVVEQAEHQPARAVCDAVGDQPIDLPGTGSWPSLSDRAGADVVVAHVDHGAVGHASCLVSADPAVDLPVQGVRLIAAGRKRRVPPSRRASWPRRGVDLVGPRRDAGTEGAGIAVAERDERLDRGAPRLVRDADAAAAPTAIRSDWRRVRAVIGSSIVVGARHWPCAAVYVTRRSRAPGSHGDRSRRARVVRSGPGRGNALGRELEPDARPASPGSPVGQSPAMLRRYGPPHEPIDDQRADPGMEMLGVAIV